MPVNHIKRGSFSEREKKKGIKFGESDFGQLEKGRHRGRTSLSPNCKECNCKCLQFTLNCMGTLDNISRHTTRCSSYCSLVFYYLRVLQERLNKLRNVYKEKDPYFNLTFTYISKEDQSEGRNTCRLNVYIIY